MGKPTLAGRQFADCIPVSAIGLFARLAVNPFSSGILGPKVKLLRWERLPIGMVVLLAAAITANAQIDAVRSVHLSGDGTSIATISGFDLTKGGNVGNTLAVVVVSESGSGAMHSVTFGGDTVTNVVSGTIGNQRASIFYAIRPTTTSGDVVVTFDAEALYSLTAVSLSNVVSVVGSGSFNEPQSKMPYNLDYIGRAGGYVLAAFADDTSNAGSMLKIIGDNLNNDAANDYFQQIGGTPGLSAGRAIAGCKIECDGSFSETFTHGSGSSSRNAGALVAFTPISGAFLTGVSKLQVFQRSSRTGGAYGKGVGGVPVTMHSDQPVATLEMRVRDAETMATLGGWQTVASALAPGSNTVNITVPAPDSARWYVLDLRPNGNDSEILTTPKFGMGEVTAAFGQSLCADMFAIVATTGGGTIASLGVTVSPYGSVYGQAGQLSDHDMTGSASWALPATAGKYDSTFAARYLERMVAALGVPCALVGSGVGSTDIRAWLPSTSPNNSGPSDGVFLYANWKRIVTKAGGKFGTLIWCQGHRSADHAYPQSLYTGYLTELIDSVGADFSSVSFSRLVSTIPSIAVGSVNPSAVNTIRLAGLAYVIGDPAADLIDGLDVELADDLVHPSQLGNIKFADHFLRSALYKLAELPAGSRGPTIQGAHRDGGVLTLNLQHQTGTALVATGNLATQFGVYDRGTRTEPYAISSVTLSQPAQVKITLASPPDIGQLLDVWYRHPADTPEAITSAIRDDTSDIVTTRGRPLALTNAAIQVVNSPTYANWSLGFSWNSADSSPEADPNFDGISNLLAYWLNLDPLASPASGRLPEVALDHTTPGGPWLTFEYRENKNAGDVAAEVQTSTTLQANSWAAVVPNGISVISEISDGDPDGDGGTIRRRIRLKISGDDRFLRLLLSQ